MPGLEPIGDGIVWRSISGYVFFPVFRCILSGFSGQLGLLAKEEHVDSKAGKQVKAYIFVCLLCTNKIMQYSTNDIPPTAVVAAKWAREEGWSKKKNGCWYCPKCK
jgi:hypothetical protein